MRLGLAFFAASFLGFILGLSLALVSAPNGRYGSPMPSPPPWSRIGHPTLGELQQAEWGIPWWK